MNFGGSGYVIFYRKLCWRKIISWAVLITFSSSLFSPVFASNNLSIDSNVPSNKANKAINTGVSSKQKTVKRTKASNYKIDNSLNLQTDYQKDKLFSSHNKYQAYFELGGAKYFNQNPSVAGNYDLFIPLWQNDRQLLFTDLRIFDRSGSSFEGNAHLGFRKIDLDKKRMFGVYAAYDYKKSEHRNGFNQVMLGAEYWYDKWFIGGNVYKPLGRTKRANLEDLQKDKLTGRAIFGTKHYERALGGVDAEVGHAFTNNLTGYGGGYYFHSNDTGTVTGPRARLTYDYQKQHGRILGVLDGVSIEVGAQHDKPRGNTAYIGIKLKVGLTSLDKNSNLTGFERHMTELVRRDPDIVLGQHKIELANEQGYIHLSVTPGDKTANNEFLEWPTEVLLKEFGLQEGATYEEVRALYKELSLKEHPDKGGARENLSRRSDMKKALKQKLGHVGKNDPLQKKSSSYPVHTFNAKANQKATDNSDSKKQKYGSKASSGEIVIFSEAKGNSSYLQYPDTENSISNSVNPSNLISGSLKINSSKENQISYRSVRGRSNEAMLDMLGSYEKITTKVEQSLLSTMPLFFKVSSNGLDFPVFVTKDNGTAKFVPLINLHDWNYKNYLRSDSSIGSVISSDNVNLEYEYEDQDVCALILLRAQEVGLDLRTIALVPPLNNVQAELQQQLAEENARYQRTILEGRMPFSRTVVFPLTLYNSHWVGLKISFSPSDNIEDVQYFDALGYPPPKNLEVILRNAYGRNIIINNFYDLNQTDATSCGPLLVENIARAMQNSSIPFSATEESIKKIRAHHIRLLEQFEPNLQFYFRQNRNIHSFKYTTDNDALITGGFFLKRLSDKYLRIITAIQGIEVSRYGGWLPFKLTSIPGYASLEGLFYSSTESETVQEILSANNGLTEALLTVEPPSYAATRMDLTLLDSDSGIGSTTLPVNDNAGQVSAGPVRRFLTLLDPDDGIEIIPENDNAGQVSAGPVRRFLTLLDSDNGIEPPASYHELVGSEPVVVVSSTRNKSLFGIITSTITYGSAAFLSGLFGAANNFLYSLLMSHISKDALSASGIILTLKGVINMQAFLVAPAGYLITQKRNSPNKLDVGKLYRSTLIISIVTSVPVIVVINFIGPILKTVGQNEAISNIVQDYFRAYSIAIPFSFFTVCNMQLTLGLGKKLVATITNFYLFVSTIGLGYGAIYYFPDAAMFSLAISTAVSFLSTYTATTVYFIVNSGRGDQFEDYQLFNFFDHKGAVYTTTFVTVLRKGVLVLISNGITMISDAIDIQISGFLGTVALQSVAIALQYAAIIGFISGTSAQLNGMLVEKLIARGMFRNAIITGYIVTVISVIVPIIFSISYIAAADYLIAIYKVKDAAVITMTKNLLYFVGMLETVNAVKTALIGNFRGLRDFVTPAGIVMTSTVLIRMPWSFILGLKPLLNFSVYGVLGACVMSNVFTSTALLLKWIVVTIKTCFLKRIPEPPANLLMFFISPFLKPFVFARYIFYRAWVRR